MKESTVNVLSLNGEWRLSGRPSHGRQGKEIHLAAVVPGHVCTDLLAAGFIKDPFWRDQAEECQWVENYEWTFTRDFSVSSVDPHECKEFIFKGLDTYATITLNGAILGQTDNMFIPHRFDVTGKLQRGVNRLVITFSPYQERIKGKSLDYEAAFFASAQVKG